MDVCYQSNFFHHTIEVSSLWGVMMMMTMVLTIMMMKILIMMATFPFPTGNISRSNRYADVLSTGLPIGTLFIFFYF